MKLLFTRHKYRIDVLGDPVLYKYFMQKGPLQISEKLAMTHGLKCQWKKWVMSLLTWNEAQLNNLFAKE